MSRNRNIPLCLRRPLLSLAAAPLLLITAWVAIDSNKLLLAQSTTSDPSFALPSALPNDTRVKLDGSSSMTVINETLKKRFQEKFPGSTLDLAANGSSKALEALIKGDIDLAAVGRLLTDIEKSQGLKQVPISREKIAIFVGSENPFSGSLTAEQFAKIFRGEIKDWSEVGGTPGPIRLIDRPDTSDTRQALSQYPVFKSAPFKTGANATQVADDTAAIVEELGKDGISYGIASQVVERPTVKVLPMHETLPTDPRYPYSQLRSYVYKAEASPQVQAFLGFATSAPGQEAVQEAKQQEAGIVAIPSPAPSPEATIAPGETTAPSPRSEATIAPSEVTTPSPIPEATAAPGTELSPDASAATKPIDWTPLWWLLLPLLGLPLLLWLMRGRGAVVPPIVGQENRIILTPRNCRDGYAYWEIPEAAFTEAQNQGGRDLKLRLYDVTDIGNMHRHPHEVKEFDCQEDDRDLHIPIPVDDRDYLVELGYLTAENRWIRLARSNHVRVPACSPTGTPSGLKTAAAAAAGTALTTGAIAAARSLAVDRPGTASSRVIMVPRNSRDAYVYWEVPDAHKAELKQQGGQKLIVRVHDVTDLSPERQGSHSVRQYEADERSPDLHIPIPAADRDYVAELGYVTQDNRWLSIGRSAPVRMPSVANAAKPLSPMEEAAQSAATKLAGDIDSVPSTGEGGFMDRISGRLEGVGNLAEDATKTATTFFDKAAQTATNLTGDATKVIGTAIAGGAAAVAGVTPALNSWLDQEPRQIGSEPPQMEDCRIILVPRNSKDAYAYWEVSDSYKRLLHEQGGRRLMLRIHDATNIDIDHEPPHSTQTYVCSETEQDKHVAIPVSDRDYIAELGYFTDDNRWLRLIRSFHVHVPASN